MQRHALVAVDPGDARIDEATTVRMSGLPQQGRVTFPETKGSARWFQRS